MMIINIITILLFVRGVFSSSSVQGSISIHNNIISINLHSSKLSDNFDELIEKLRRITKPQIHLIVELRRKVIEINGEIEQDYIKVNFDNEVETNLNNPTNVLNEENVLHHRMMILQRKQHPDTFNHL
ncbi:uncharacterized protein LOC105423627 [Pogonomyrmex barbatus]|uniref:Uncharacterized protein LOC105423627 n=1 Tax=Pogonomyrmex barbatus TaxID=144034 RepID=A0A6I9VS37_9HYME|nr:uncharacterized protein LOC105423627 [Pogonomyrmex barbatus]XP_011631745.1 uncharacterized protein LOC105423627 [Pogonomyrmex barbatus]